MGTKYSTNTISGYNKTPVADDGSQTEANKVKFSTITTNLSEPLKNLSAAIDSDLVAHFDVAAEASKTGTYTVDADDDRRLVRCIGTFTVNLPTVSSVGNGFEVTIKNEGTGVITIDANGAQTIDGSLTFVLRWQYQFVTLRSEGVNNWDVIATNRPGVANRITSNLENSTAYQVITGTIPAVDSIPQNTQGAELITAAITPKRADTPLIIECEGMFTAANAGDVITMALFQDSTSSALAATGVTNSSTNHLVPVRLIHIMTSNTTSSTTFKIRVGAAIGNSYVNGNSSGRLYGGRARLSLKVTELQALG